MAETISIEDYRTHVGTEMGVSDWLTVTQSMIDTFADLTDDHAFIHVDPERARSEAGLGGTIAHGFLSIALIATLVPTALPRIAGVTVGFNYGFDKLRLIAPVPSGKRIRGRFRLLECAERASGEWRIVYGVTVEVEGQEKPALVAYWIVLNRIG